MSTVAEHVPFLHLCKLCQKISEKKGRDKKKTLRDFIENWRNFHNQLHKNDTNTTDSFYPALRLLLPQSERQRAAYGIKEFTLAKLLIEIFCLDKNGVDAKKLINYRSPKSAHAEAGDFASVAYFVLKNRSPEKGTLTIHDINYYLDSIASNSAAKMKDEMKGDLLHLLRNTSAIEQKWLIRIILKDMKLGISENSVLNAFHPDAKDLYNVTNSLEKVCTSLRDPSVRLHEIEISLFSPFRPMLAEIALPNQVEELMQNKSFIVETKYDGERLQLHKDGDTYMYFSRGGHDCTDTYGNSPSVGTLTPYISKCFKPHITSCILDGEIVIYSSKLNCIVSKGENAEIQAMQPDGDYGPCFCVFDILMVNGKVLSNLPLTDRVIYIKDTFTPIENKIRYTEQKIFSKNAEVVDELNSAIDNRLEGIVIKNPESIYKPNMRKGGGWLKVKPDYIDNLMDELDLLIIGGYFGEGRRSSYISHFLLGVAVPDSNGDEPKCFHSFCKVGSGYSLKELYELSGKLGQHWEAYNPKKSPSCLVIGGGRKEQPDVWIEPSKSQIVQVKAAEIVRSSCFTTNYTLRFPRVEKIRYDKPWYQCMTTTELENLRNLAEGRLATRNIVEEEEEPSPKKKKLQKEKMITIAPHFRPTDISDVQQISELLKDKEICVMSASLENKQQLERKIAEYGGKFVQNPGSRTFCVVSDKVTAKVRNIISTNAYDVVTSDWLNRCFEEKTLLPWVPDDLLHSTEQTREKLSEFFDAYGDSYTQDATVASLSKVFNNISKKQCLAESITTQEIAEIEESYFPESSPFGLFRKCRIYVSGEGNDTTSVEHKESKLKLVYFQLKLYGADMCSDIDSSTSHVVIHSSEANTVKELNSISAQRRNGRFHIVTEKWVSDCIKEKKLLQERGYMPLATDD
ncbi:DNA ligase 4-like [Stegodyphus dumicola]|uniref:DNA ligase 4-like n=1 Tax=Stegodyphus dumicola TaxID=202533 RepID=UPI0015AE7B9D|nr:DNA ligase 4-like [Stegodyphus dumicola]